MKYFRILGGGSSKGRGVECAWFLQGAALPLPFCADSAVLGGTFAGNILKIERHGSQSVR